MAKGQMRSNKEAKKPKKDKLKGSATPTAGGFAKQSQPAGSQGTPSRDQRAGHGEGVFGDVEIAKSGRRARRGCARLPPGRRGRA